MELTLREAPRLTVTTTDADDFVAKFPGIR